jgi:diphthine-ammonia ligase
MGATALVSGGKDSIYAASLCEAQGWPVEELVTIQPADPDSMLYHTPNLEWVRLQAAAWGTRHRVVTARGADEAAELAALAEAVSEGDGPVVAGAIESSFQWARLVRVADAAKRRVFVPLWRKSADRVVRAEIDAGLDIRLVHLAAEGLTPDLLGRRLDLALLEEIGRRSSRGPRVHPAGEGGEYETLVVDAPFFSRRLELEEVTPIVSGATARLEVRRARLAEKLPSLRDSGRP